MAWRNNFNDSKNFLIVQYEDLLKDLKGQLKKIAKFLQISIDNKIYKCVVQNSKGNFKREKKEVLAENILDENILSKAKIFQEKVMKKLLS